jgi:hypothetical protein
VGYNTQVEAVLKKALPSVDVHVLDTFQIPAEARTALWAFAIAHSTQYIGDLEPLFVKIGLILGLGTYGSFPILLPGNSSWNDAYGFASCPAEEFNAHQKVAAGASLAYGTGTIPGSLLSQTESSNQGRGLNGDKLMLFPHAVPLLQQHGHQKSASYAFLVCVFIVAPSFSPAFIPCWVHSWSLVNCLSHDHRNTVPAR